MSDKVFAPFTPEQVDALTTYQTAGFMHPFTCGGGGGPHSGVSLYAQADGWHCPVEGCTHRQDWAHAFMADRRYWPDIRTGREASAMSDDNHSRDKHPLDRAARDQGIQPITDPADLAAAPEDRFSDAAVIAAFDAAIRRCRGDNAGSRNEEAEFAHDAPHPTPIEVADRMLVLCRQRDRASVAHVESLRNLIHEQAEQLAAETTIARDLLQRNVELGTRAGNAEATCDDLREQLAAANDTTPSTAAAWEVDAYATRYTAYSTDAADEAPGWLPVDAMHAVVAELAAANKRAEAAKAQLVAANARADMAKARLAHSKGVVDAFHAEADRMSDRYDNLLDDWRQLRARLDGLGGERVLMYRIIGAIEHAYALNTYVELEPGETAPTVESLWAEVRELRGMAPDAAADGHSATQTGGDRHGETNTTPDGTGTETTRA